MSSHLIHNPPNHNLHHRHRHRSEMDIIFIHNKVIPACLLLHSVGSVRCRARIGGSVQGFIRFICFLHLKQFTFKLFHIVDFTIWFAMERPSSSTTIGVFGDDGKSLATIIPRGTSTMDEIHRCLHITASDNDMEEYDVEFKVVIKPKKTLVPPPEQQKTRVRLGDYGVVEDFDYLPSWKGYVMKKKVLNFLLGRIASDDEISQYEMYFRISSRCIYVWGIDLRKKLITIVGDEILLDVVMVKMHR